METTLLLPTPLISKEQNADIIDYRAATIGTPVVKTEEGKAWMLAMPLVEGKVVASCFASIFFYGLLNIVCRISLVQTFE